MKKIIKFANLKDAKLDSTPLEASRKHFQTHTNSGANAREYTDT